MVKINGKDYFVLVDHEAVEVWVENGLVIIADNRDREEYPNTLENQEMCIREAQKIIKEWEEN